MGVDAQDEITQTRNFLQIGEPRLLLDFALSGLL